MGKISAIISLPNGEIVKGECEEVKCNKTTVEVTINRKRYIVHSSNIVLIEEETEFDQLVSQAYMELL